MGLELAEKVTPAKKALREDLAEKVKNYESLGWSFDLDHKKSIFEAKLEVGNTERSLEVVLNSNASVENLLLQIEQYYEDIENTMVENRKNGAAQAGEGLTDGALEIPENTVKCGNCQTEFDFSEADDCPECGTVFTVVSDEEKPKKKLPKTAVAQCRVQLTSEELLARGDSLSKALDELKQQEAEFDSKLKALKSDKETTLSAINQRITRFNLAVSTKSEWRDVVCHLEWDFEKKEVSTIRPDTGETVKTRPMRDDELQMELFD